MKIMTNQIKENLEQTLKNTYGLEIKTKYLNEVKNMFIFEDEVFWYENDSDIDYKYVSVGLKEEYMNCETMMTGILSFNFK